MASKELGMLHSVNFSVDLVNGASEVYHHDLSGQLTEQLQRMVRQGQYYKIAGIDVGLAPKLSTVAASGTVTGRLKYYQPTRGRCAAYRAAFKAMAEAMKVQGITMRDNMFYDFRVPINPNSTYANATPFANGASFDGVTELTLAGATPSGMFAVHNSGVQPVQSSATFSEGFGVFGNAGNDFVLNENTQGFEGNVMIADDELEEIPFQVSIDTSASQGKSSTLTWEWRPDPALYLAILAGQFEFVIDECTISGGDLTLTATYSVAGWKSIMGNPDRKRRSRRSNGNSSTKKTTTTVTTVKK
jgi:hypothetical protein